jgi:tetratricopeptide (TPR) repeat protein
MFELLLQADQALVQGLIDDAEKRYEQVLELEPTNAIAVAGLARIAFERGDTETAAILVQRALALDSESVTAIAVAAAILGDESAAARDEGAVQTLAAARQLGAVGRPSRRLPAEAAESAEVVAPTEPEAAHAPTESLPEMSAEVLKDRSQLGRHVAAAAAAMHDVTRPIEARRRANVTEGAARSGQPLTRLPVDPFAMAESAAAVEAVDAFDELEAAGEATAETLAEPRRAHLSAELGLTAEAEALREALAIVLETDTEEGPVAAAEDAAAAEGFAAAEPAPGSSQTGENPPVRGEQTRDGRGFAEQHHRRRLFGRLGGR